MFFKNGMDHFVVMNNLLPKPRQKRHLLATDLLLSDSWGQLSGNSPGDEIEVLYCCCCCQNDLADTFIMNLV